MPVFEPLTCPLPNCGHQLHLTWTNGRALYADDLADPPALSDLHTSTWEVRCEDGHVVLLPDHLGCGRCRDEGTCPGGCDVDSDDDYRTFRLHDAGRLAALLAAVQS
jgi:hypothetical protein